MKIARTEVKKIAVFRALQLGDMLCAVPAIRALHHAYPNARITLLGLPWSASLAERFPEYIHRFKHFPGYPGLPEQDLDPSRFTRFLKEVQDEKYDLVLQMQGNGSVVNPMVKLLGGKYTAGFCLPGDYCPDEKLCLPYPTGIHEIERHLALVQHLGINNTDTTLAFPLYQKDEEEFRELRFPVQPHRYVCVHPGSRSARRQWPVEHFAQLANECSAGGYTVVLTGTKDEWPIVTEVAKRLTKEPVMAAGKTSLGAAGVLLRDAALLISNCTGVSHMAAALKTPSVVISMDGEPERWAPLNKALHRTINWLSTPDFSLAQSALHHLLHRIQGRHQRNKRAVAVNQDRLD